MIATIQAAMFAAIGNQTRLSRSGCSVVFSAPQCGRHDLSDDEATAVHQARAAGLDLDGVTPEQIEAYQRWHGALHDARRVGRARILVTRRFGLERGHQLVPANCVTLVDGWGNRVDSIAVPCREYRDPGARNRIGGLGAYRYAPDYTGIDGAIAELRQQHPEFAGVTVHDNNRMERGAPSDASRRCEACIEEDAHPWATGLGRLDPLRAGSSNIMGDQSP